MQGITAILLAAGLSKRFGAHNKLLADIAGEPMVRRVAAAICASQADRLVVVLGHQADRVGAVLSGLPLETIVNPNYADGQVSSVRAGVGAIGDAAGFMMCLADQPQLKSLDYDVLIDAFAGSTDQIVVPYFGGKRGNPLVFPIQVRDAILAGGVNVGCRKFVDSHPELVRRLDLANPDYRNDFDTPDAFAANGDLDHDGHTRSTN